MTTSNLESARYVSCVLVCERCRVNGWYFVVCGLLVVLAIGLYMSLLFASEGFEQERAEICIN